jgi:biotin carboxyl carrier protein
MKLENEIQSAFDGRVKEILVENGSDVHNKDVLIVLE